MDVINNYELRTKRVPIQFPMGKEILQPNDIVDISRDLIGFSAQEHFLVFMLDATCKILGYTEAARGGITQCVVDPRVVFRMALILGATGVLLAHNHPSGNTSPSDDDVALTRKLVEAGNYLGISVVDHVVVSDLGHSSFRAMGLL